MKSLKELHKFSPSDSDYTTACPPQWFAQILLSKKVLQLNRPASKNKSSKRKKRL